MDGYLSTEEERELVKLAHAGDIEARNKVVMNVSGAARKMAMYYAKGNRAKADAYQAEAIAALCEKFHKFDLAFDCKFLTWAMWWIRHSILRYIQNHEHKGIRIPVGARQFVRDNPSDFRGALIERAKRVASADAQYTANQDGSLKDLFIDKRERDPDDSVLRHDRIEFVRRVMVRIHPRYREILQLRTSLSLEEVGEKLGITRERVRQLEAKAQLKFVQEAERTGLPIVQELEQDIRDSNRHWAKNLSKKRTKVTEMDNSKKETKSARVERFFREHGLDVRSKDVKERLGSEGYTIYDSEISIAKRKIAGVAPQPKAPQPKVMTKQPTKPASSFTIHDLKEVRGFAETLGGFDQLIEICSFLKELAA